MVVHVCEKEICDAQSLITFVRIPGGERMSLAHDHSGEALVSACSADLRVFLRVEEVDGW